MKKSFMNKVIKILVILLSSFMSFTVVNAEGKTHTYSTKGKKWKQVDNTTWTMDLNNDNNPDVTLKSSKDSNGNTRWTYTFNVEDDTQEYYVYEAMKDAGLAGVTDGYTSQGSDGKSAIEVDPGMVDKTSHSYTITNTKPREIKTGDLKITKNVTGTMRDPKQEFKFTVKLSVPNNVYGKEKNNLENSIKGTKIFGNIPFNDGTAVISLKKDESILISNIPTKLNYSISESQVSGYTVVNKTNNSGTISEGTKESVWTNHTDYNPPDKRAINSWQLKKIVTGDFEKNASYQFLVSMKNLEVNQDYTYSIGSEDSQTFHSDDDGNADVTLNLKKDDTVIFKDIPVESTYQVVESAGENYISSYEVANNQDGNTITLASGSNNEKNHELSTDVETLGTGENITVTFTNDYPSVQSLTIEDHWKKKTDGKLTDNTKEQLSYEFTIRFSNIPQDTVIDSPEVGNVTPDQYGESEKTFTVKTVTDLNDPDLFRIHFTGIPKGVRYQITQGNLTDYPGKDTSAISPSYLPSYSISTTDSNGKSIERTYSSKTGEAGVKMNLSTDEETLDEGMNDQVTFVNVPAVNFGIIKYDDKGEKTICGATYELLHYDGNSQTTSLGKKATDNDGFAGWNTIEDGVYILKEIQAPPGYSVADDIVFKLDGGKSTEFCSSKDSLKDAEKLANGNLLQKLTMEGWTATEHTVTEAGSGDTITYQAYPVKEKTSNPLPVTGGRGTRFFLFFGSLLIGFSLIMMRRREKNAVTDSLKM